MSFLFMFHVNCLHIALAFSAGPFVATQTVPGDHFGSQKWSPDRFWLPNLVLLGPVLVRWDHFWKPKSVRGSLLGRTNFRVTVHTVLYPPFNGLCCYLLLATHAAATLPQDEPVSARRGDQGATLVVEPA